MDDAVLKCPYCNEKQIHHTDEVDADIANITCYYCDKLFHYSVSIEYSYNSWTDEDDKQYCIKEFL